MIPEVMTPLCESQISRYCTQQSSDQAHHYSAHKGYRKHITNLKLEGRINDVLVVGLRGRKAVEECTESGEVVASDVGDHEYRADPDANQHRQISLDFRAAHFELPLP